jgi:ribose transport system substrate-binding protein
MPRSARVVLAAIAACMTLGCGSGQPANQPRYRIAVIPKGLTNEFWLSIRRGAERAGSDLTAQGIPVEILWDGPRKESDLSDQISIIQQKAAQGIQGMVLAPQSRDMVPQVEDVVHNGIKVVIIDSGLDKDKLKQNPDLIVKYVATDNHHGGWLAAEHLLKVLEKANVDNPRIVLFRYQVGSESTEQREQGFLDYLEDAKKKGKKFRLISDNVYAGATVETATGQAGPLLNRLGGEIDGVFAPNESSAAGMLSVMRSLQLNKKIRLVGFDASEQLLQALREGDVDGLIVQDPYRMGYLGVWAVVRNLEGDNVRGDGKDLSTGENVVTRDNLDDEKTQQLIDAKKQLERKITPPTFKK